MEEIIVKAHKFTENYKKWFTNKVKELGLPPWTSLERNLYWIEYSLNLSLEILHLIKQSNKKLDNINILDLGIGKGFISFLFSSILENGKIYCIDTKSNSYFKKYLSEFAPQNIFYTVYNGYKIPFEDNLFNLVLLIEVIEHIEKPILVLKEALRVAKKNGILIITIPPRLKFLLKKDPHFGLLLLYLLPLNIQKFIIEKILNYDSNEGYNEYNVFHLFWNIQGIKKLLYKTRHNLDIVIEPPNSFFTWNKIVVIKKEES